jgi:1,4-dihydroxy-2-naphthoyl-CoA synthase
MDYRNLLVADDGGVRTITLNRPEKLNALNRETIAELDHAVGEIRRDDSVRVVVLTGAGSKAFVAGADISELSQQTPASSLEFSRFGQAMMTRFERLGKPVIAKIGGFALGGSASAAGRWPPRLAATHERDHQDGQAGCHHPGGRQLRPVAGVPGHRGRERSVRKLYASENKPAHSPPGTEKRATSSTMSGAGPNSR